ARWLVAACERTNDNARFDVAQRGVTEAELTEGSAIVATSAQTATTAARRARSARGPAAPLPAGLRDRDFTLASLRLGVFGCKGDLNRWPPSGAWALPSSDEIRGCAGAGTATGGGHVPRVSSDGAGSRARAPARALGRRGPALGLDDLALAGRVGAGYRQDRRTGDVHLGRAVDRPRAPARPGAKPVRGHVRRAVRRCLGSGRRGGDRPGIGAGGLFYCPGGHGWRRAI